MAVDLPRRTHCRLASSADALVFETVMSESVFSAEPLFFSEIFGIDVRS